MRHLFAWDNDTLVGRFDEGGGRVSFEYEPDATYPISLSLPLDGRWHEHAPAAFLEGLLPEEGAQRLYMMNSIGARSTDAFDLLDGVDSTGGLVFTTTDTPIAPVADAGIARELDIEAQMQRIYDAGYAWWNGDTRNRFSLAGNQGKFSLSRIGGMWFWPNATLPSTHIIKPDGQRIPSVAAVEHASMEVARQLGLPVANTTTIRFGEREGLLVERFDRVYDAQAQTIRRIRTEDMTQALGAWNKDKYGCEISQLVGCLHDAGADEEACYGLVRQIVFNAGIGNSDAHAKNYSVFLGPSGIDVTPMYDVISMAPWPEFKDDVLAMPVNGIYDPWEVTIGDWRAEAKRCALDPDRVEEIVREIEEALHGFDYDSLPCGSRIASAIRTHMHECSRDLMPSLGLG